MENFELLKDFLKLEKTLGAPELPADHKLNQLLEKTLSALTVSTPQVEKLEYLWTAEKYGLDRSELFTKSDSKTQEQVLKSLSDQNLGMSYFIEKTGFGYTAKMSLLSETVQEKALYSLFAADEAIHLREVENFLTFKPTNEYFDHPLLEVIATAVKDGNRDSLIFLIQVVLEGFGLAHYDSMREHCRSETFGGVIQRILKDEARHHGSGLILSKDISLKGNHKDFTVDVLFKFIRSMQSTADRLPQYFEKTIGPLTMEQKEKIFVDIGVQKSWAHRVQKMKGMIEASDRFGLVADLDKMNAFRPLTIKEALKGL